MITLITKKPPSDMREMKIRLAKSWLYGRITLYKIKFAETDNNEYLNIMNNYNEVINHIKFLEEDYRRIYKENIELKKLK